MIDSNKFNVTFRWLPSSPKKQTNKKIFFYLSLMKSDSSLLDIWPCFMLWYSTSNPLFLSPCQKEHIKLIKNNCIWSTLLQFFSNKRKKTRSNAKKQSQTACHHWCRHLFTTLGFSTIIAVMVWMASSWLLKADWSTMFICHILSVFLPVWEKVSAVRLIWTEQRVSQ